MKTTRLETGTNAFNVRSYIVASHSRMLGIPATFHNLRSEAAHLDFCTLGIPATFHNLRSQAAHAYRLHGASTMAAAFHNLWCPVMDGIIRMQQYR